MHSRFFERLEAVWRMLAYRKLYILGAVPSIGILLLVSVAIAFFAAMTFGSKPYYWPNTEEKNYGSTPPLSIRSGWMALALLPFVL
jgi:hypothetical protein